jgi:hypothetical protein
MEQVKGRGERQKEETMTREEYLEDRKLLDDLNRRIDEAPSTAKPVFMGICGLHRRVFRYEKKHSIPHNAEER